LKHKNGQIVAMLRYSLLHMNNYAPPRALPDDNLAIFITRKAGGCIVKKSSTISAALH
jgi:hypothetical protein